MKTFIILAHIAELMAAILATFYFYKYKNSTLKYFVIYLWYVVLNETAAYFLLPQGIVRFELTNLYGFITPLYVIWTIKTFIPSKKAKHILLIFLFLMVLLNLGELFTKGLREEPWTISKIAGPLLGVAAFSIYLASLFKLNIVINLFKDILTYFLLGFTLFFVASPIILLGRTYYLDNYAMSLNLSYIMGSVVIAMYLIFSFGFYWGDKIQETNASAPVK